MSVLRSLIHNALKNQSKYIIIDGDNFKFIPLVLRNQFLHEKSSNAKIAIITKNKNVMYGIKPPIKPFSDFDFYHIKDITSDIPLEKQHNSFCFYFAHQLLIHGIPFEFYSNNKYRDITNYIKYEKCIVTLNDKASAIFCPNDIDNINLANINCFMHKF